MTPKSRSLFRPLPSVLSLVVTTRRSYARLRPQPLPSVSYIKAHMDFSHMDLSESAYHHMRERLDRLSQLMAMINILSKAGRFPTNSGARVVGATLQAAKGSKKDDTQAAHVALTVEVAGKTLDHFTPDILAKECIKHSSTYTHTLPTVINTVDSWMEKSVLRKAVEIACNHYLNLGPTLAEPGCIQAVLAADYSKFAVLLRGAIEERITYLKTLNPVNSQDKARIIDMLIVLDAYWRACDTCDLPESVSTSRISLLAQALGEDDLFKT